MIFLHSPYPPALLTLGLVVLAAAAPRAEEALASNSVEEIVVTSRKLDKARDSIQADLGASRYVFDRQTLDTLPQGSDRGLSQILLQAPGVTQDSYGEVHIRNEHGNVQYRINGVILPAGPSGFDQGFDSRFADKVALITGTLPAQYGYRTAGVVDITTKSGALDDGGEAGIYGGSHNTFAPSFNYGGSSGGFSYFMSASYSQNDLGIENPTDTKNPLHDRTKQGRGFAYFSQILSPSLRLSAILGSSVSRFEIPNNPNQTPAFTYLGQTNFSSALLDDYQREGTHYGILALQYSGDKLNVQVAPFVHLSHIRFYPDLAGDLIFNGIADRSNLRDVTSGLQVDGSYTLSSRHTLRAGAFFSAEHSKSDVTSLVFAVDQMGAQSSDIPLVLADASHLTGYLYGIYLQDEWAITPEITLNYGARFDMVRGFIHEQQLSPRINLVWKPREGTTFHAGFARNFTPPPQELVATPTLNMFNGTTKQSSVLLNDPVRAERESYYDGGVLQTILPGLDLGIDSYIKKKRNLLDEGQFGAALVLTPFNYSEGWSYGLEFSAAYHQGPLNAYANAALAREMGRNIVSSQFLFAEDELDYIAAHKIHTDHDQKWTVSGGFSYRLVNACGSLTPAVDVIYGSGLRRNPADGALNPNGARMGAYAQVNFGIVQAFSGPGWLEGFSLRLDVTNLFDHVYQLRDGSGVGLGAPQYGPRRAFYAGVNKSF
jgi:outer membrane receptor protein involved in Fe transport